MKKGSSNHSGGKDAFIDVMEALRLQVQCLEQNFQHYGTCLDVVEDNDKFGKRVNCHHQRAKSKDSNHSTPPHPMDLGWYKVIDRDDDGYHNFNPKLDIPKFEGKANVDDFLDLLNTVESVFEYHEPSEHKKWSL